MAITDPHHLHDRAIAIVEEYRQAGCSDRNVQRFRWICGLKLRSARPLFALQKYLSDFILKADGLGVI
jgi:hypothetical protein